MKYHQGKRLVVMADGNEAGQTKTLSKLLAVQSE
jgi:hypothetical protein